MAYSRLGSSRESLYPKQKQKQQQQQQPVPLVSGRRRETREGNGITSEARDQE